MSGFEFAAEKRVVEIARKYAEGLVDLDKRPLDFSDQSVQALERLAAREYDRRPRDWKTNPESAEKLDGYAKVLGFYVGEVMRRHHGAKWGFIQTPDGERVYGVQLPNGTMTSPISKAFKRLTNGAEDDLWFYFKATMEIARRSAKEATPANATSITPQPPGTRSRLGRIFRRGE